MEPIITRSRSGGKSDAAAQVLQMMYDYWAANLVWNFSYFGMSFYVCINDRDEICIRTMDRVLWNLETGEVSTS